MTRRPTPAQSPNVKRVLQADLALISFDRFTKDRPKLFEHYAWFTKHKPMKKLIEHWENERQQRVNELSEDEYAAYLLIKHEQQTKSGQTLPV